MKLTVSKSKNSASFYVQKTIRKSNGSVTTVTVEKLGNLDEVKAKAKGQDPYGWAQEYVNELNRKEYEEQKEIILSYAPSKLIKKNEQKTFNCGYLFLQDIYYSLGLDKICSKISSRHLFEYDLNDILSKLVYARVIFPSSKLSSNKLAASFIEQPSFELHDIYRALSILAEENDFIQAELYKNSQKVLERRRDVLYYDCTNYFFELEEADDLRKYGKSKQHQPLPIVGMGLFMDYDGIPLAFDIYPGNKNEQPTLKPLEKKILKDYGLDQIIVCTDAGLSSKSNRKFNDKSINGERLRSFITTQSVKQLPEHLKEFALDRSGWHIIGDTTIYNIEEIDESEFYDKIFYKDRWIKEDLSGRKIRQGAKPLEQHLIVSYSPKYKIYQRKIRQGQVDRATVIINSGKYKQRPKNQNDPHRFIGKEVMTEDGEACTKEVPYLKTDIIAEEEKYDGFYAVCTNLDDMNVAEVIHINKKRWEIEECFRIMKTEFKARPVYLQREDRIKAHFLTCFISLFIYRLLEKRLGEQYTCEDIVHTLRDMNMYRPGEKRGYIPAYTRTDLTDALHETAGFRTDYEILTDLSMKKVIRESKKK
ncbi:IS1634 family transposase [[Clostridium] aminophilum]|uniref:IS1634 family transposase n=1 Tax=[Clostridium] aminophilum TaxID=1526 RepID=UPI00332889B8